MPKSFLIEKFIYNSNNDIRFRLLDIINMVKKVKNQIKNDLFYVKDDKLLKKVEKYVDSKREQTSKEIIEKRNKRPATKYQEADLEVMISRISNESQPKNLKKKNTKKVLYILYTIIMMAIVVLCIKYFFMGNLSQISQITR